MSNPCYEATDADITQLFALVERLDAGGHDPSAPEFFDLAWELTSLVPIGFRRFLNEFRLRETSAVCLVRGIPVDDLAAGPTPGHWASAHPRREEFVLALLAMCLGGEVFNWSTLQGGRLIHNVVPIAGEESEQSGHGQVRLAWHTEDGFHPYRCDYLLLYGVRNHARVPTTISSIRDVRLAPRHAEILREPRFHILPDDEHLRQLVTRHPGHRGLLRVRKMRESPERVAVLFGAPADPYLRIDPAFMGCADDDPAATRALTALIEELERVQRQIVVEPGSLLVIDNFLAVHGREAFAARFDGRDRWLKKALVTRDLRRSRDMRVSADSRVVI